MGIKKYDTGIGFFSGRWVFWLCFGESEARRNK